MRIITLLKNLALIAIIITISIIPLLVHAHDECDCKCIPDYSFLKNVSPSIKYTYHKEVTCRRVNKVVDNYFELMIKAESKSSKKVYVKRWKDTRESLRLCIGHAMELTP